jgi:hypothetical protein
MKTFLFAAIKLIGVVLVCLFNPLAGIVLTQQIADDDDDDC